MANQPEDIFQEVEPVTPKPDKRQPGNAAPMPPPDIRGVRAARFVPLSRQQAGGPVARAEQRPRWLFLVGGAIVLVVGIAVATVLIRRAPEPTSNSTSNQNSVATGNPVASENTNAQGGSVLPTLDVPDDRDRDGILDAEEKTLGTNGALADTDGDSLSDYDEVRVYETNPLKPDTDGDGNADGAEVEKGYNPKGTGLLLDFAAARQKLTP